MPPWLGVDVHAFIAQQPPATARGMFGVHWQRRAMSSAGTPQKGKKVLVTNKFEMGWDKRPCQW